jgi:hypothetical protein
MLRITFAKKIKYIKKHNKSLQDEQKKIALFFLFIGTIVFLSDQLYPGTCTTSIYLGLCKKIGTPF